MRENNEQAESTIDDPTTCWIINRRPKDPSQRPNQRPRFCAHAAIVHNYPMLHLLATRSPATRPTFHWPAAVLFGRLEIPIIDLISSQGNTACTTKQQTFLNVSVQETSSFQAFVHVLQTRIFVRAQIRWFSASILKKIQNIQFNFTNKNNSLWYTVYWAHDPGLLPYF